MLWLGSVAFAHLRLGVSQGIWLCNGSIQVAHDAHFFPFVGMFCRSGSVYPVQYLAEFGRGRQTFAESVPGSGGFVEAAIPDA
ncbi:hypothetical protein NBRC116597_12560 [Phaeobacter sp. NW0010-22]